MPATKNDKVMVWNTDDLQKALAAGHAPKNIRLPSDDVGERIDAARHEGYEKGLAAGRSERISTAADNIDPRVKMLMLKAEAERISTIQALTEPGFEKLAKQAVAEIWGLEQFALAQLRDKKDRGITLSAIRADAPKAAPFAPPGDDSARAFWPHASAAAIFEKRKRETEAAQVDQTKNRELPS